jgi:hypothetical protein
MIKVPHLQELALARLEQPVRLEPSLHQAQLPV